MTFYDRVYMHPADPHYGPSNTYYNVYVFKHAGDWVILNDATNVRTLFPASDYSPVSA